MPQRLYGRLALRLGLSLAFLKATLASEGNWSVYTPEMLDYCIQDTEVTLKLWALMKRRMEDYLG